MKKLSYVKINDLESRLSYFDITTQKTKKLKGLPPLIVIF